MKGKEKEKDGGLSAQIRGTTMIRKLCRVVMNLEQVSIVHRALCLSHSSPLFLPPDFLSLLSCVILHSFFLYLFISLSIYLVSSLVP